MNLKGSLSISVHEWRKPEIERVLFVTAVCLGFISVGYSKFVIDDELRLLRTALRKLRGAL